VPQPVLADALDDNLSAVEQARSLVAAAQRGEKADLGRASALLKAQASPPREIIGDLSRTPPNLNDARQRLDALARTLHERAAQPDPAATDGQLKAIMAQHRYDSLRQPPSPLDRFFAWLGEQWDKLMRLLFRSGAEGVVTYRLLLLGLGALALLAVAVGLGLAGRRRFAAPARVRTLETTRRLQRDRFDEADRLAAAGDYLGAVRELALGVALRLGGLDWEESPDTVREAFMRSTEPDSLRPLLLAFEAGVYGHRPPRREEYEAAARVARLWREEAAA
jgi:hypothetical protein